MHCSRFDLLAGSTLRVGAAHPPFGAAGACRAVSCRPAPPFVLAVVASFVG